MIYHNQDCKDQFLEDRKNRCSPGRILVEVSGGGGGDRDRYRSELLARSKEEEDDLRERPIFHARGAKAPVAVDVNSSQF